MGPTIPAPLPLTMPEELWLRLAPKKRELFVRAQTILDGLGLRQDVSITDLCEELGRPMQELLAPLRLLRALELIEVGPNATLRVIAVPDEPVRAQGPDGRWRWIFVKRRLTRATDAERLVWN